MTVAMDTRLIGAQGTGDSTYWQGLLHGLAELDDTTQFLLFSNAPKPREIPNSDRFRWVFLPGSSRWFSLVRFPLAARRMGAHVIHTQYNLSPLVGKRGITTIHDVSFLIEPSWFLPKDRFLLRTFVPRAARRAAKVITVSQTSKKEIEQYIPLAKGKTVAIYNAAGLERRRLLPEESDVHLNQLGITSPFLLTVGTRWPRKNMGLAIQACNQLPESMPHHLVIAGKFGWGDEPRAPRMVTPGYVTEDQLNALYSSASLYLAPSRHEGFGVPLLEAFRCGCPVICSSGGAFPEVAGKAALVMNSWEASDWSKTIHETLSSSSNLEAMREAGFEREREFSWTRSAREHLAVYREVSNQ